MLAPTLRQMGPSLFNRCANWDPGVGIHGKPAVGPKAFASGLACFPPVGGGVGEGTPWAELNQLLTLGQVAASGSDFHLLW